MPCYVRRYGFDLYDKIENTLPKTISKKDFVYIQSACVEFRDVMVKELMEKFKIDCVGRCLNNTNIKVNDKLEFIKNYNFVISFENSSTVGYSTEKLTDSFVANSIPVYFGDPNVSQDFYEDSFVNLGINNIWVLESRIIKFLDDRNKENKINYIFKELALI